MAYLPAQEAFFQTGAGANFDLQGIWSKISALSESPWSELVDATAKNLPYEAQPLLDIALAATETLIFGTDSGESDLGEQSTDFVVGLFNQAIAFGNANIEYDFYNLL
jgi:hypothetical protein